MPATKPSAPDQWYIVYTRDFECTVAVHFREEGGGLVVKGSPSG